MADEWEMRRFWGVGLLGFVGLRYFQTGEGVALFFFLFFAWLIPMKMQTES